MADSTLLDTLTKGAGLAGTGGTLALLIFGAGQLLRGWQSGTGPQEKELRGGLAERITTLEARLGEVEKRLDAVTQERDGWRWLTMQARLIADTMALKYGIPPITWPDDPHSPPPGGTP